MSLISPAMQVFSVSHGSAFLSEEVGGWCMAGNLILTLNHRTVYFPKSTSLKEEKKETYWRRTYNPLKMFKL